MHIIGYAFEADLHCLDCTPEAYKEDDAEDREGNPVHPVFDIDEAEETQYCGDCHEEL